MRQATWPGAYVAASVDAVNSIEGCRRQRGGVPPDEPGAEPEDPGGVLGEPGVGADGVPGDPGLAPDGGLTRGGLLLPGGLVPGVPGFPGGVPGEEPEGGVPGVVPDDPGAEEPGCICADARFAPAMPIATAAKTIGLII